MAVGAAMLHGRELPEPPPGITAEDVAQIQRVVGPIVAEQVSQGG